MNPIRSGIPAVLHYLPVNVIQQELRSEAQAEYRHPYILSTAKLSLNTRLALHQFEAQPNGNGHHHFLALLASNGIAEGALQFLAGEGTEVYYHQSVDTPSVAGALGEREEGKLTVSATLNQHSQYDIMDINLYLPSSDTTVSINLTYPPPAITTGNEPFVHSVSQQTAARRLAARHSQGQLTQVLLSLCNPRDFSGYPMPLGASASTPSTVISHEGSAAGAIVAIPGPVRHQAGHAKRFKPYPASPLHSEISTSSAGRGVASGRVPDPQNPGRLISRSTLSKRHLVPDPENPGQMISRNTLSHRKQVPDPENPGATISRNALSQRKQVPDPDNPGQFISRSKLKSRQQVPDPENPGRLISRSTLKGRQQVPDPDNSGHTIPRSTLNDRNCRNKRKQRLA